MSESQNILSRVGSWFRKDQVSGEELPPAGQEIEPTAVSGGDNDLEPRNFLRPWARRDQAIDNLNRGLGALSELLVSIRDNMDRQAQRQEDLIGYLATIPEVLKTLPESNRIQGEALQAIQQQMERQTVQQSKLGDVLERLSQADSRQGSTLDALQQTVSAMNGHDEVISRNLTTLGVALESMTHNSQASTEVLEHMRDSTARRDGELENIIKRHNTRFTTLLSIAIVLSIAALTTVSVVGYLAYDALTKIK